MQTFDFYGHQLSRIFKGNWQLAGGHGNISHDDALNVLKMHTEHGVNVFDVGDIYTGSELLLGEFMSDETKKHPSIDIRVHTKFVPDLEALETLTKGDVRKIIERSIRRLGVKKLHLVQFHWWDFTKGDYLAAAGYLQELKDEGLIEQIGVTNMDVQHLSKLLENGVEIVSNQIQFSLIDPRPLNGMLEYALKNDIKLFCYGVLAGGLLGDSRPGDEPNNRSHIKYNLIINEAGSDYYQKVLSMLDNFAAKYDTSRANVAAAFILAYPGVDSIILGPRNGNHLSELDQLSTLQLSSNDFDLLSSVLRNFKQDISDDIYSYERNMLGPHGSIMKYNLNGMRKIE